MLAETLTEQNGMTQCITLTENMSPLQTSQSIVLQKKIVLENEGLRRMECWELGSGRRVGGRQVGREGKGEERMEEQQKKENKNSDEEHKRNSSGCESCMFSTC